VAWTAKNSDKRNCAESLAATKADIDKGLADIAAGRVKDFDADRIVERGRKLLASR
jgi:antitoxin ParD1/3/4